MLMTSFNIINGIPATVNKWLIQELIRKELGFNGIIISDYSAIEETIAHGYSENEKMAALNAINAGVDIDMMSSIYANNLKELCLENGDIENKINISVLKVLNLKNKLGLFENPYGNADEQKEKIYLMNEKNLEEAKKLTQETFVLLKNNKNILPLKNKKKIALKEKFKMRADIINYLEKEIYNRASQYSNKFGIGVYYHIESVVKNAKILAQKFGADEEVVIIAAWLHDIASITDYSLYEMHHIYGASIAEDILKQFDYEQEKINKVKECILNHRGSVSNDKLTIEEKCVADADAISHFDSIPSLLYLAYVNKHMNIKDGRNFVIEKLKRSYGKLSETSKEFYKDKYNNVMELL